MPAFIRVHTGNEVTNKQQLVCGVPFPVQVPVKISQSAGILSKSQPAAPRCWSRVTRGQYFHDLSPLVVREGEMFALESLVNSRGVGWWYTKGSYCFRGKQTCIFSDILGGCQHTGIIFFPSTQAYR